MKSQTTQDRIQVPRAFADRFQDLMTNLGGVLGVFQGCVYLLEDLYRELTFVARQEGADPHAWHPTCKLEAILNSLQYVFENAAEADRISEELWKVLCDGRPEDRS